MSSILNISIPEILQQNRHVELWNLTVGDLLLWARSVPENCEYYLWKKKGSFFQAKTFFLYHLPQPLADVVKHVGSGYKMEAPEGCPPEIYEMMRQAWDLVPEKRPTFAELKRRLAICKRETAQTYVA